MHSTIDSNSAVLDESQDSVGGTIVRQRGDTIVNEKNELAEWDNLEQAILHTGIKTVRIATRRQLEEVLMLNPGLMKGLTVRTNNEEIKKQLREAVSDGTIGRAQQVLGRREVEMLAKDRRMEGNEYPPKTWQVKESNVPDRLQMKEHFTDWIKETRARLAAGEHVDAKIVSLDGVRATAEAFVQLLKDYPDRNQLHIRGNNEIMACMKAMLKTTQAQMKEKTMRRQRELEERDAKLLAYKIAPDPVAVATPAPVIEPPVAGPAPSYFSRAGTMLKKMWPWGKK